VASYGFDSNLDPDLDWHLIGKSDPVLDQHEKDTYPHD
jgi:hypothetical protein